MIPLPDDFELQDPATIPIKKEEAREQARLVGALRRKWATIADLAQRPVIFHVANGGSRDAREAGNLKVQGVLSGVPDLFVMLPMGEVLTIEMKARDGRTSKAQDELHAHFNELGHEVILAFNAEDALAQLRRRLH